jgi:hypothetical protein
VNVTVEPENLLPAAGAVIADGAVVTAAAEAQVSIASINPHASCAQANCGKRVRLRTPARLLPIEQSGEKRD